MIKKDKRRLKMIKKDKKIKTKSFRNLVKSIMSEDKIKELEFQAQKEAEYLTSIQKSVWFYIEDYMKSENIGFNEMARRINTTPSQMSRIKKCEANLTISTIAHIFSVLNKEPNLRLIK